MEDLVASSSELANHNQLNTPHPSLLKRVGEPMAMKHTTKAKDAL